MQLIYNIIITRWFLKKAAETDLHGKGKYLVGVNGEWGD